MSDPWTVLDDEKTDEMLDLIQTTEYVDCIIQTIKVNDIVVGINQKSLLMDIHRKEVPRGWGKEIQLEPGRILLDDPQEARDLAYAILALTK